jgi:hypothetical protein
MGSTSSTVRRGALTGTLVLALFGAGACGAIGDKAAEKATEKITESATGADNVDIGEDGITIESGDGAMSLGSRDVPEDWPRDLLPIPDDVEDLVSNSFRDGESGSLSVSFTTSDDPGDVTERYADSLLDAGWEEQSRTTMDGMAMVTFVSGEDGDAMVTVNITDGGEGTQVNLTYLSGL